MADPISISSGVAGLVSLGLTVCSGISQYYVSWKDSEKDTARLRESLDTLTKTFTLIKRRISGSTFNREAVDRVTESLVACAGAIDRLNEKLDKLRCTKPGIVSVQFKRSLYPFHTKTLEKLQGIVDALQTKLGLALQALNIDASVTTLEKLTMIDGKITMIDGKITMIDGKIKMIDDEFTLQKADSKAHFSDVTERLTNLRFDQQQTHRETLDRECMEAIAWLSPLNFRIKQNDVFRAYHPGTGRWLLQSTEFQDWLDGGTKTIWCPGIPGAGKTVLASTIINHLEHNRKPNAGIVVYVYCTYNDPSHTAENLIASLLEQLCQHKSPIHSEVSASWKHHTSLRTRPLLPEWSNLLQIVGQDFPELFVVIDALDECSEQNRNRDIFLEEVHKSLPHARLLVTSRHIPAIQSKFRDDSRIDIRASDEDVKSFLTTYISQREVLADLIGEREDLREEIVRTIVSKTKGMFLRAALHINAVSQEDNLEDLMAAISRLPQDTDLIYKDALQRIRNQTVQRSRRAEQILMGITFAQRPLKLSELLCALAIRPGDQEIVEDRFPKEKLLLSACCGLVIVDEESQIIRFVHYTMDEYIASIRQDLYPYANQDITSILLTRLNIFTATAMISEGDTIKKPLIDAWNRSIFDERKYWLLKYTADLWGELLIDEWNTSIFDKREYYLVKYAADFWGDHAYLALETESVDITHGYMSSIQDVKDMIIDFLGKCENVSTLLKIVFPWLSRSIDSAVKFLTTVPALSVLSALGLHSIIELLLKDEVDLEQTDSMGYTALHYAVKGKVALSDFWGTGEAHYPLVRLLLANNANINACGHDGRTPLGIAAYRGDDKLVVYLLSQGADLNVLSIDMRAPLMEAIKGGSKEIIQLLFKMGADIYLRDRLGCGVLHEAIERGDPEIANLLLVIGADIESSNNDGHTPLAFAVLRGHSGITKLLLDLGADPSAVSISRIRDYYSSCYIFLRYDISTRLFDRILNALDLVIDAQEKINKQFLDEMVQI